jgi:hypothetical protein
MKIRPVRAELFMRTDEQMDGQTNVTKLIADFRKFANVPKSVRYSCARNKHGFRKAMTSYLCLHSQTRNQNEATHKI